MADESKSIGVTGDQRSQYYGTFQGVANYPPPPPQQPPAEPVIGFPQPSPPPGANRHPRYPHVHYHHGYQTAPVVVVEGYALVDGHPFRERRLPCCGLGVGWLLRSKSLAMIDVFIFFSPSFYKVFACFFLGGIPWYLGAFILVCVRVDYREKPGYVACMIATIIAVLAITLGVTKGARVW